VSDPAWTIESHGRTYTLFHHDDDVYYAPPGQDGVRSWCPLAAALIVLPPLRQWLCRNEALELDNTRPQSLAPAPTVQVAPGEVVEAEPEASSDDAGDSDDGLI
jgi:hypothetical protein